MRSSHWQQSGLSLVELMVGITVGLIVSAAAAFMAVNQITEHRRLMSETQVQQDLRATGYVIQQDIQRAGFRGLDGYDVWAPPSATDATVVASEAAENPYLGIVVGDSSDSIEYRYLPESVRLYDKKNPIPATKLFPQGRFGLRLSDGVIYLQVGADNWQPLTDPESVTITSFAITPKPIPVPNADDFCDTSCPQCIAQNIRTFDFVIKSSAKNLNGLQRGIQLTERVKANEVTGSCSPAPAAP